MSARLRFQPWFRSRRAARMRWWKACAAWRLAQNNRQLYAATRPATVTDVPEEEVRKVLG